MLTGQCLCGNIRFEINGRLGPAVYCHCSMCRRATGTAFATNASVRAREFRIVAGAELLSEYESSPSNIRAFCSRCGSPLYCRWFDLIRIRLGTLNDDPGERPIAHVWVSSKAPWHEVIDSLERFDEAPPARYAAPSARSK
jgi:hypothetical protein